MRKIREKWSNNVFSKKIKSVNFTKIREKWSNNVCSKKIKSIYIEK